jgi:hypothetical protein
MALEDALKFGITLFAIDEASSKIAAVEGNLEHLSGAMKAFAGMEAFQAAREGIDSITEAAAGMETVAARVKAVTGLQSQQLTELTEHAEAFSETHIGATAEQYMEIFGRAYPVLHNFAAAQKEADDAVRLAGATGANYIDIVELMNVAHENLGASSTDVANKVAATTRQFSLAPEAMQQLTLATAKMAPALKAVHGNLDDALAIGGQAEQLMGGGRGTQLIARLVEQLPGMAAKAHLNLNQGLTGVLEQIRARTAGLGAEQKINVLAGMKIDRSQAPEILRLIDNLDKIEAGKKAIASAGGSVLTAEEAANAATYNAQVTLLSHAWTNLKETLGKYVLPYLTTFVQEMSGAAHWMRMFAENNPLIVKIGIGILAIAGAAAGLGSVGIALSIIGSGLKVIRLGEGITKAWAGAQWLLNAAMDANPIVLTIAAIVALGVAVYEIYKHWSGIKVFFIEKFQSIVAYLLSSGQSLYNAGAHIIGMLAAGIESAALAPIHAVEKIAASILGHFKGHSPPPLGPLRELNQVRIIETIAETFRAGPALTAMRRTAAAIALAAPMTFAPMLARRRRPQCPYRWRTVRRRSRLLQDRHQRVTEIASRSKCIRIFTLMARSPVMNAS